MQTYEIFLHIDDRLAEQVIEGRQWNPKSLDNIPYIKEDRSKVSKTAPVFAIADGVPIRLNKDEVYPKNSGSGRAAQIFCDSAIDYAEKADGNLDKDSVIDVFKYSIGKVRELNEEEGRTVETVNNYDFDYFTCAATFAFIRDKVFHWGSLADTRIAVFSNNGKQKILSPDGLNDYYSGRPSNFSKLSGKEQVLSMNDHRNKEGNDGSPGYGVVTGEKGAINYIKQGTQKLESGDFIVLFTDGLSPYFKQDDFIGILKNGDRDIDERVCEYIDNFVENNTPKENNFNFLYKYASERLLILVNDIIND